MNTAIKKRLVVRKYLEIIGVFALIVLVYSQFATLKDALKIISESSIFRVLPVFAIFWLILPLTALSITLLYPKRKKPNFIMTNLALLAGAGPGKIIPAGTGTMALITMYFNKAGLSYKQAVSVATINNLIGMITSFLILLMVIILKPESLRIISDNVSSAQAIIGLSLVAIVIGALVMVYKSKSSGIVKSTLRTWLTLVKKTASKPYKLILLIMLATLITFVFTLALYLSAKAINVNIPISDLFLALSIGVTVGGLAPTPGGVGGVEAGIIISLVALGYSSVDATSITILFRTATYIQPILPGLLAYIFLKRKNKI